MNINEINETHHHAECTLTHCFCDEGQIEKRGIGVDELEQENLCDHTVFKLHSKTE